MHCQKPSWRCAMQLAVARPAGAAARVPSWVSSPSMYSNTSGSRTKKAPLIHSSASTVFSRNAVTRSPAS